MSGLLTILSEPAGMQDEHNKDKATTGGGYEHHYCRFGFRIPNAHPLSNGFLQLESSLRVVRMMEKPQLLRI